MHTWANFAAKVFSACWVFTRVSDGTEYSTTCHIRILKKTHNHKKDIIEPTP